LSILTFYVEELGKVEEELSEEELSSFALLPCCPVALLPCCPVARGATARARRNSKGGAKQQGRCATFALSSKARKQGVLF
jgi:hypothetical protein